MINLTPEEIRTIISATMLQHNNGKLFVPYKTPLQLADAFEALRIAGERIIEASVDKERKLTADWMRNNVAASMAFQWKDKYTRE